MRAWPRSPVNAIVGKVFGKSLLYVNLPAGTMSCLRNYRSFVDGAAKGPNRPLLCSSRSVVCTSGKHEKADFG
jgi:hypothetical protein